MSLEGKLDYLLDQIDYRKTIDPLEHNLNNIAAQFTHESNRVGSHEELDDILAAFGLRMMQGVFNVPTHVLSNFEMNKHEAFKALTKHYDYPTIYDIALSGAEGGLRKLLDIICTETAIEYSGRVISSHVSEFWYSLSTDEQVAVSDVYLRKFAHVLPGNQSQYRIQVKMKFWEVLKKHPAMMKRAEGL